ncbi:CACTA en-spm transposon protein [Cucumis melo var. makuwa]|uniref:CACTA en-spm transposon protein n=1 Tax=Cucumis melo var. makuwa TaxID=1194695 RepID=A0A5D3BK54_CUCMM|nr:CACTA en-spm transposon protein [Cucumis melo var. makuwa]
MLFGSAIPLMYVRDRFPIHCLKWANVGREYIEQGHFIALNRFVKHQMLTYFKESKGNCYRHFKKYNDSKQARNQPIRQIGGMFGSLALFMRSPYEPCILEEQSQTNKATKHSSLTIIVASPSRFYNDSTSSLRNEVSQLIVWCYSRKHMLGVSNSFVGHPHPTLEGSQPLSGDEICEIILGRRPCYSKGLDCGPKPKSFKNCASSSSTSFSRARDVEQVKVLIEQQRVELE